MPEPIFRVHVSREDYPSPTLGDLEHDEELGPIAVTAVEPESDGWLISYGAVHETSRPNSQN